MRSTRLALDSPASRVESNTMNGKTLLAVIVILGGVLLVLLFLGYGYDNTWQLWNIPTLSPNFADLRTITGGAESARMGFDPMVENPADPWGRTMDYPRIWMTLFALGIDQGDTLVMGLIMIAAFLAGLFLFVKDIDRTTALVLGLAIFSPAVLLGIERGNNDLLIFFLLAAALVSFRRSAVLATGLITLGAALMYFPIFGLVILLGVPRRRRLQLAGVSLGLILIYVAATFRDFRLVEAGALKGATISYGFNVLHTSVRDYFLSTTTGTWLEGVSLAALVVIFVLALRTRGWRFPSQNDINQEHLDAFRMGAAIYIGTFLLGNNWDYRLMFLLFTIPQLVQWTRAPANHLRQGARITLLLIMASYWLQFFFRFAHLLPYGGNILFVVDEMANWTALAGLLYLLPRSAPRWMLRRAPAGDSDHLAEIWRRLLES